MVLTEVSFVHTILTIFISLKKDTLTTIVYNFTHNLETFDFFEMSLIVFVILRILMFRFFDGLSSLEKEREVDGIACIIDKLMI